MMGGTHALIGGAIGLGLALHLQPEPSQAALIVGAAVVGALLPDIDHTQSILGRRLWLISVPLSWFVKHRGVTHTLFLWGLLTLSLLASNLPNPYRVALSLGYVSHLAADMVTFAGLNFLWPLWRGKVYLMPPGLRFSTGGRAELLFAAIVALSILLQIREFTELLTK